MSNQVILTVGKFQPLDDSEPSFGYIISDSYARDYNFMWDSEYEFLVSHPTARSLWESALSHEGFDDIEVQCDEDGNMVIENDAPLPSEIITASSFSLEGISY